MSVCWMDGGREGKESIIQTCSTNALLSTKAALTPLRTLHSKNPIPDGMIDSWGRRMACVWWCRRGGRRGDAGGLWRDGRGTSRTDCGLRLLCLCGVRA